VDAVSSRCRSTHIYILHGERLRIPLAPPALRASGSSSEWRDAGESKDLRYQNPALCRGIDVFNVIYQALGELTLSTKISFTKHGTLGKDTRRTKSGGGIRTPACWASCYKLYTSHC
jgi:hypothetical protein